jgi:hypothetical protein
VQTQVPNVALSSAPSAVVFDNVMYVFYQGEGSSADELLYTALVNESWSQPAALAADISGTASAIVATPSGYSSPQLFVFYGDGDGVLFYCQGSGSAWNNGQVTAASSLSSGTSATVLEGEIYVFYQGASNALCYSLMTASGQWFSGTVSDVTISQSPAAVTFTPPTSTTAAIYLFYTDSSGDGLLWYVTYDGSAVGTPAQLVPAGGSATTAIMSESPAAAVFTPSGAPSAQLFVCYQGPGSNAQLWCSNSPDGISWTAAQVAGASMANSPSVLSGNGTLNVIYEGSGSSGGVLYAATANGSTWTTPIQTGMLLSNSPSLAVFNNLLCCFTQGTGGTSNSGNGELCGAVFNGTDWSWNTVIDNVSMSGTPSAVVYSLQSGSASPQLFVFYQSAGLLWYMTFNGTSWSAPVQVIPSGSSATSQILSQSPSAVVSTFPDDEEVEVTPDDWTMESFTAQALCLFYQGPGNNGALWANGPSSINSITGFGAVQMPGSTTDSEIMSQSPASAVSNGYCYVVFEGPNNDGQLWCGWTSDPFSCEWDTLNQVTGITGYSPNTSPSIVFYNDSLYVFYSVGGTSSNNCGSLAYSVCTGASVYTGTTWSSSTTPTNPGNNATYNMYGSPAAVVFNNLLYVFFQDPTADGVLWYTSYNASSWSTSVQAGCTTQMGGLTGTILAAGSASPDFMNLNDLPFEVNA